MAPHENRTFGSVVAVGVVCALLLALPRPADAADLGESASKTEPPPARFDDKAHPQGSILDKKPADAAVASKKAEGRGDAAGGQPFWEKWQFWALAGGVVAASVLAVIVIPKIVHEVNGGDVRPCPPEYLGRCFGEGH